MNVLAFPSTNSDHTNYITASLDRLIGLIIVANLFLLIGIYVTSVLSGQDFLPMLDGEKNAVTWFSSLQLLLIALAAFFNREVICYRQRGMNTHAWIWTLLAFGFVFLSVDERFALHELLRDHVLAPRNLFDVDFRWWKPGDIVLFVYAGVGLVLAGLLLHQMRHCRSALALLVAAVCVAGTGVLIDSLPGSFKRAHGVYALKAAEELSELGAQLLFALSFLTVLRFHMGQIFVAQHDVSATDRAATRQAQELEAQRSDRSRTSLTVVSASRRFGSAADRPTGAPRCAPAAPANRSARG